MERELVEWLREALPASPLLKVGLGDDAAVLSRQPRDLVVTTDSLGDGTHFLLADVEPKWIGHKCLAVNLSDLAAMAAEPLAAVISLMLPREHPNLLALARGLYQGMLPLADRFGIDLCGGDTNTWQGPLTVSVTAFGQTGAKGPLLRTNAQPGDAILVTGELGGSITGGHLDFTPRIDEALLLHQRYELNAGMDLSDGLSLDLDRLCQESGCGAVLEEAALPVSPAAEQLASASGGDATQHALSDGEDFELLLIASPDQAERVLAEQPIECGVTRVGQIVASPGLQFIGRDGKAVPLTPAGYLHD